MKRLMLNEYLENICTDLRMHQLLHIYY